MINFIKNQIIKQGKISKDSGQAKYAAYFINTNLYEAYKSEVDKHLIEEGFDFCILKEE